ncbi:MAG: serine hydrolase, partial [Ruminococcus sp.]
MKKKILAMILSCILVSLMVCMSVTEAAAANYKNDVKLQSESALVVNMDTGQTVYEVNANKRLYPASTTKIMTYIVVAESIEDFENTKIEIKQSVLDILLGTGSSVANVSAHVGEEMTVIDLLYSMMVPSGND